MPEPELHSSASAPRPVKAGLGVEDIRHIPARERELRFTRNRAGSVLLAAGFLLIAIAVLCLIAGSRCLKHAAVIVTPVGVEILPFLRARRAMQWCFWQQIRSADRKGGRLNLRLTDGSTVAVSLRSMTAASREMLVHAVRQRVNTLQCSGYGKA